jgi:hypothetical protein
MGAVAKSYMRMGFLIYEEMLKYLVIYEEEAVSYMTLQLLPSGFPCISGKFCFLFYQCTFLAALYPHTLSLALLLNAEIRHREWC